LRTTSSILEKVHSLYQHIKEYRKESMKLLLNQRRGVKEEAAVTQ
jgi:hypothetical protein